MIEYSALFEPDDEGGFVITVPDLGHGATQAETMEEGIEVAEDFLQTVLWMLIKNNMEIPPAKKRRGRNYRVLRLSGLANLKVELYRAFLSSGIRKAELARRLGTSKGNIERLFDLRHSTRFQQMEAAFAAIGKRLAVEVHEAA